MSSGGRCEGSALISTLLSANGRNRHWPSAQCSSPLQEGPPSLAASPTMSPRKGCNFLQVTPPFTASQRERQRLPAPNGWQVCIPKTASDGKHFGAAPTEGNGRSIVGNIELFARESRFAGSRRGCSCCTPVTAGRSGQWALTSTSPRANAQTNNSVH